MIRLTFAGELEGAADRIADISRADLQIMLRRAALMLRSVTGIVLDLKVDESLSRLAAEMDISNCDLIRTVVGDWLTANAYLPVPTNLEEDSETAGCA